MSKIKTLSGYKSSLFFLYESHIVHLGIKDDNLMLFSTGDYLISGKRRPIVDANFAVFPSLVRFIVDLVTLELKLHAE